MGFLRRLFGSPATPSPVAAASVVPATLDPSWPVVPPHEWVNLSTSEINALPFEATACPTCGVNVAKPPKGRKKCTSCGVYMFVIVIDKSRRRLVTEAEMQRHAPIEQARWEKEQEAADRKRRSAVKAAGVLIARSEDEAQSTEVVGESHYQQDLASLMAALRTSPDQYEVETVALLVREPNNRYDRNAVQVQIHRRLVGYLASDDAQEAQTWLKRQERNGKAAFVLATIGGGRDEGGSLTPIGVTLDDLPESIFG
jgi:uncharacterized Zn finger protein (UPF0148 family)